MDIFYNADIYRWGLYFLAFYIVDRLIFADWTNLEGFFYTIGECIGNTIVPVVFITLFYNIFVLELI